MSINTETLAVGTLVRVDESHGLGRAVWEGRVTLNGLGSPFIYVNNYCLRRYEVVAVLEVLERVYKNRKRR